MSNEERQEQYELFVLGLADAEAAEEIRALVASGDAEAQRRLAAATQVVSALALSADLAEPPASLRDRILASAGAEPQRRNRWAPWLWLWAAATAALVVAITSLGTDKARREIEVAQLRAELASVNAQYESVAQVRDFLNEPQLRVTTFGQAQPRPPRGRVLVSPTRGVLLLVNDLPPAATGRTYEMWIVPKQGGPRPAGLFQTSTAGSALHVNGGPLNLDEVAAIAVSNEPASGSTAPTTTPFVIAPLGARPLGE